MGADGFIEHWDEQRSETLAPAVHYVSSKEVERAANGLFWTQLIWSAKQTLTLIQWFWFTVITLGIAVLLFIYPAPVTLVLGVLLTVLFLMIICWRIALVLMGLLPSTREPERTFCDSPDIQF